MDDERRAGVMGWSLGFDTRWKRDIGYGVPAFCDHPGCGAEIDRGLSYVCGGEPYGGERGCGLYFCERHLRPQRCEQCEKRRKPFAAVFDHPEWRRHKLTHESWAEWRAENPKEVESLRSGTRDAAYTEDADAARYRWLRDPDNIAWAATQAWDATPEQLDDAIDSAREAVCGEPSSRSA